jgi:hypothetical protein
MKHRINRRIRKLAFTTLVAGLSIWLALLAWRAPASASAQGAQAVAQLKEQGLYDSLQQAVAAARYELRWEAQPALRGLPPAFHAPNPAQRLSAWFTPHELQLAPLDATPHAAWRAALRFAGYGYADRLWPVGEAELAVAGDRIEYQRAGVPVIEWYINQPGGLEQGFTLTTPPGGKLAGEPLRLALELSGDLRAELVEEGRAIALRQPDGELALRYGGLYVTDARRRELPSHMRVVEGQVWLEADDEGAVYPVTVDPTFGLPVKLTASDGAANDSFGNSLALSGDTLVVGALNDHVGSNNNQGSVYVFVRSGSAWSEQAKLTASDGAAGAHFGGAVAISGDTLVVGADTDHGGQGAVYVFIRNGSVWLPQAYLTAHDGAALDFFGKSVAISADTIVVGASGDNLGSNQDQGSAYVFGLP